MSPAKIHDAAVVGAGVFGVWTAAALKRAGLDVALLEMQSPGHARASSGGESRIIRVSYGGDPLYGPMAQASLAAWEALSARQGLPIFHRTGVLWFSPADDPYMRASLAWLAAQDLPHRELDGAGLAGAFPQIAFRPGEAGFVEAHTGALIAGRGVQSVVADAGLAPIRSIAHAPQLDGEAYRVAEGVRARHVVYACGPWLPKLFPDALAGRIVATRQEVYHFAVPPGDARFAPPALPVWADFNAGDLVYGFPDLEGQGFKLAFDAHGPEIDPDTQDRRPTPAAVDRARAYLGQRFPGLAGAPLIHARVCQYENSCNGDFLIDRLPGHDRVWLVGAGSGHGFKHGPAVGDLAAAHVLDPARPVEPRFSLAEKAVERRRAVW